MLQNTRTCIFCGKMFRYVSVKFCPSCGDKVEEARVKVSDYLYEHENAPIAQVIKDTETDEKIILHLIKEGHLKYSNPEATGLTCGICKRPITHGKWCEQCSAETKKKLDAQIASAKSAEKPKPAVGDSKMGMYIKR